MHFNGFRLETRFILCTFSNHAPNKKNSVLARRTVYRTVANGTNATSQTIMNEIDFL